MNELNETILIRTEVPTCACNGCYYFRNELGHPCAKPVDGKKCCDSAVTGKFYIFVEQPQTK